MLAICIKILNAMYKIITTFLETGERTWCKVGGSSLNNEMYTNFSFCIQHFVIKFKIISIYLMLCN